MSIKFNYLERNYMSHRMKNKCKSPIEYFFKNLNYSKKYTYFYKSIKFFYTN